MKFETHSGVVTRNTDDEEGLALRGAIFFQADTLLEASEYPDAAIPCFGFASAARKTTNGNEKTGSAGFFWVPEPGDFVDILLEDSVEHPRPMYMNMFYNTVNDIAREFKKNYTKRMGWKSKSGSILLFDDKKGEEIVNLEHTFGSRLIIDADGIVTLSSRKVTKRDNKDETKDTLSTQFHELVLDYKAKKIFLRDNSGNSLEFTPNGSVWKDKNGNSITMDAVGTKIVDKNGNSVVMNASGIKVEDKNGNTIELSAGGLKAIGVALTTVGSSSSPTKVDGQTVALAGGGPPVARLGDMAIGTGNMGAPVVSNIIKGSTKVTSA